MADLERLLAIRLLQERICEERLIQGQRRVNNLVTFREHLQHQREQSRRGHLEGLAAGNQELAVHEHQALQQLDDSSERLSKNLLEAMERVKTLALAHLNAHQQRRRCEILAQQHEQEREHDQQRSKQRSLDDAYLAGKRSKQQ